MDEGERGERERDCTAIWRVVEAVAELSLHTGGSMTRSLLGSVAVAVAVAIDVACSGTANFIYGDNFGKNMS